jgi:hypothetical protein
MKIFASQTQYKQKLFFGNADSFTLINQQISKETILRELKLSCLLYDHVVLAAAYFWQSDSIRSLIPYVETFIEKGHLLPAIRDYSQTSNASDYLERRIEETSVFANQSLVYKIPAIASEVARLDQLPIANELNQIGTFFHMDSKSIEDIYRRLWIDDIFINENPSSLYNLISVAIPPEYHSYVVNSLQKICKKQYFSRSIIASCILELRITREEKRLFIQRASALYLLSNAIAINGDLLVGSRTLNLFCNYQNRSLGPLSKANVDLFLKVLELCGLPTSAFDRMSGNEILDLKCSEEFIAFRNLYFNLIDKSRNIQNDLATEIIQRFSNVKKKERVKRGSIHVLNTLEFISSAVFANTLSTVLISGFSPAVPAVILGSGVIPSLNFFLKRIEGIQKTPFLDFNEFLKDGKFYKKLHDNLSQLEPHFK